jgi:hypothetical protein
MLHLDSVGLTEAALPTGHSLIVPSPLWDLVVHLQVDISLDVLLDPSDLAQAMALRHKEMHRVLL